MEVLQSSERGILSVPPESLEPIRALLLATVLLFPASSVLDILRASGRVNYARVAREASTTGRSGIAGGGDDGR